MTAAPQPLFVAEECVELGNERIGIRTVNGARRRDAFTAGSRAAEAVHPDRKEELRGVGCEVENVADNGFFRDLHESISFCFSVVYAFPRRFTRGSVGFFEFFLVGDVDLPDVRTEIAEFADEIVVPALDQLDIGDLRFALGHEPGDHKRDACS